ncbi:MULTISPECIES: RNA methyltransferase [Nitrospirillum]|uniref:tRNA (cytidine/uridine-2'-O-)-methyltransferase TrmJ n=1 Tax=Nitrospirillum amazonense TaxID=28077 RepID=A0A560FK44_9PROT|nr:tRNA/rRNA methyltransferase [Nitrospirillum amazonense]TWB63620.1 tRNA/rRNA methyltransferase [Nitrospirillum amazonense]
MSGTDRRMLAKSQAEGTEEGAGPAVILVEPQLGENIGTVARAMLNHGLTDLRLVNPRDGWPNEKAVSASAGATLVLDQARVYESTKDAIADLQKVYATTARPRYMVKTVLTAREAATEMRAHAQVGRGVGILFGPERTGLVNDDIALADTIITIPLNPGFSSLNLAQCVLLVAHEWFQAGYEGPERQLYTGNSRPATKEELVNLFEHLELELDATGFYTSEEKRPSMVRNIRNMLQRAHMTEQEVRTLHGVIAALTGRRKDGGPVKGH